MSKGNIVGFIVTFILGFVLSFYLVQKFSKPKERVKVEEEATTLLERIEAVSKLITVEGFFSEVYQYKDYWKYDISLLRKKALLRIKAKVSVGYDMSNMDIAIDETNKEVILNLPAQPEILSIDHDLDYYNISEGTFNSFSENDYNKLEDNAKSFIREKALESDLMQAAEDQFTKTLDIIRFISTGSGYNLKVIRSQPDALTLD
ncbi:MAG: DUF4230 domain-containing protein [Bacteroidia bacterium]|nr:DUF4230 domain-containing protein [Bacteroidia bacterium]